MHAYGTKDVERILRLPRGAAAAFARRGLISPRRGSARKYQFSFQDLIVLRAARSLAAARVPGQRIHRSLARLRRQLPGTVPLSGLSICCVGDEILVREGAVYWESCTGQYVLQFDVVGDGAAVRIFEPGRASIVDASLFERALDLEHDVSAAIDAYRRCLENDPHCVEARINCGRLLHAQGSLLAAEQMYRGNDAQPNATLLFNLGVLLEDLERLDEARHAYHAALRADALLADAHYNLAILAERRGRVCDALRHLNQYRKLSPSRR